MHVVRFCFWQTYVSFWVCENKRGSIVPEKYFYVADGMPAVQTGYGKLDNV